MIKKVLFILILILTLVAIFISLLVLLQNGSNSGGPTEQQTASPSAAIKVETATVRNDLLGISFEVPRSFSELSADLLKSKNPLFLYGFKPADSKGVECFVSQTMNTKEGDVTLEYLREGLLGQFKKSYEEVTEEDKQIVDLGDIKGAKLTVKYKIGEDNYKLIEVAGSTKKTTTFLSCSAPYSIYPVYKDQFDVLFNSLKITSTD